MILLPQKVAYRGTISGLRISAVDGTAFIDNLSGATLDLGSSVVKATGTAAIRISSVDGTAFVDTADATLAAALAANAGKYLVITDASGRYLKGWIKAAGTGETLGEDVLAGWDFTSGWAAVSGTTINDLNTFTTASGANGVYKQVLTAGVLYKRSYERTVSAGDNLFRTGSTGSMAVDAKDVGISTGSDYRTAYTPNLQVYLRSTSANQTDVTSLKCEQVLTPSTSGATIVSTKGGTTYNFESKDASFTYNAASYTYTIYDRDVTALADGNHLVEIYDASGRMLRGYLGAAGTGETLGGDVFASFNFTSGWGTSNAAIVDANTFNATSANGFVTKPGVLIQGTLYKGSFDAENSAGVSEVRQSGGPTILADGETGRYFNAAAVSSTLLIRSNAISTVDVATLTMQQVLTPSTSGATIVSAKGGATQNFAYKNASFTYNEASYYCLIRKAR